MNGLRPPLTATRLLAFEQAGLLHSDALTFKEDQVTVVQQPVKDGCGHLFIVEDVHPAGKLNVGIDHQALFLVALGDDFKEQLCPGAVQGNVSKFVQKDQIGLQKLLHESGQGAFLLGFR